jgi:phage gp36-like protein
MAYASRDDLIARLGGPERAILLTDPKKQAIQTALLDEALAAACAAADSYLARRYAVPIAATQTAAIDLLRGRVLDLAELSVWAQAGVPDRVQIRYDQAIGWLKDVARGLASLPCPEAPAAAQAPGFAGRVAGGASMFGESLT